MKTSEELSHNHIFKQGYIQGYNGQEQKYNSNWTKFHQEYVDHRMGWRQGVADAYTDGVERTEKWIMDCLEEGSKNNPFWLYHSNTSSSQTEEKLSQLLKRT